MDPKGVTVSVKGGKKGMSKPSTATATARSELMLMMK